MVVKVSEKEISTKELKNGGEITTIPYGMAVWSTGIGTRPFIKNFMAQIGQVSNWEIWYYTCANSYTSIPYHVSLVACIYHSAKKFYIHLLFTQQSALSLLNRLVGVL